MTDAIEQTQREIVANALFALSKGVSWRNGAEVKGFVTREQKQKPLLNFPTESAPALFQVEFNEQTDKNTRLPYKRIWHYRWIVYNFVSDDDATPSIELNRIMTAIERCLAPTVYDPGYPDDRNTLGGLCHKLEIKGETIKDPGDLDKWGLLVVPIAVMVP